MGRISAKMCEVVQQISFFNNFEKDVIETLKKHSDVITEYCWCIHDKDKNDDGTPKVAHIHLFMRLKDSRDFTTISNWFPNGCVPVNCINKIKAKRFDEAIPYLIHVNALDKYQYEFSEVVANFDYKKKIELWENKQDQKDERKENKNRLNEIIERIGTGEIRKYNLHEYIDIVTYSRNKKILENAFKYREETLKGMERNMETIFMTGDSGAGKTTFAKEIAKKHGYSYYISSGSNDIFSDYAQQDCIILDDLRGSSVQFADILKALDPFTSSTVKSRYYNKVLCCKLIIITTVKSIDEFYQNVFEHEDEPIVQFKRRCQSLYRFSKDKISIYIYDSTRKDYVYLKTIKNPIKDKYPDKPVNKVEELQRLKDFLGDDIEFLEDEEMETKHNPDDGWEQIEWVYLYKSKDGQVFKSTDLQAVEYSSLVEGIFADKKM